jgi:hypothetical protein
MAATADILPWASANDGILDVFIFTVVRASWTSLVLAVELVPCWPFLMEELYYCKDLSGIEFGCRTSS